MSGIKTEESTTEPTPVLTSTPLDQNVTSVVSSMDTLTVSDSRTKISMNTPAPRSCTRNVANAKKQPRSTLVLKAKPATVAALAQPKTKTPAAHPPFFEMIIQAIRKLNDRTGSSRQAILKFIISNFKVEEKQGNQHVKIGLKNAVKAGTLKQVKGVGASGSFKLSDALKTREKVKEKKQVGSDKALEALPSVAKPPKKPATKNVRMQKASGSRAKLSVVVGKKATKTSKTTSVVSKAKMNSVKESAIKPVVAKVRTASTTPKKVKTTTKAVAKSKLKSSPTTKRKAKTTVQAKKNGRSLRK